MNCRGFLHDRGTLDRRTGNREHETKRNDMAGNKINHAYMARFVRDEKLD
jgi:hypothetical protein